MSVKSKIGWTDRTWNPVSGCSKISPACDNCYAERMSKRLAGRCGYPKVNPFEVTLHPDKLPQPLKWRKPSRIFVVSMGDLFHEDVPSEYIAAAFGVMMLARRHAFQVLTKRPQRALELLTHPKWPELVLDSLKLVPHEIPTLVDYFGAGRGIRPNTWPRQNIWLGVTAEDQWRADERIPVLLQIPAAVLFVSIEPMLANIDITKWLIRFRCIECDYESLIAEDFCPLCLSRAAGHQHFSPEIDWVICGGEKGPGARPMHIDWVRSLRDQCVKSDTPFFLKDGQELDGRIWEQFPEKRGS